MSLIVQMSVTKSPTHLEQIGYLNIQNVTPFGPSEDVENEYEVTYDGRVYGVVLHRREDGAVRLTRLALALVEETGILDAQKRSKGYGKLASRETKGES